MMAEFKTYYPNRVKFVKWLEVAKQQDMNKHESDLGNDHIYTFTDVEDGVIHAIFQIFHNHLNVYLSPCMEDVLIQKGLLGVSNIINGGNV